MKTEENKGYKIVSTSNYNSLFFVKNSEGQEDIFNGTSQRNLLELLTDPEQKVNKERVLDTLKSENGKILLLETIRAKRGGKELPALVAACWEAGIDMSTDLDLFVDIAIKENILAALEALTVIEQMSKIAKELNTTIQQVSKESANTSAERKFVLEQIAEHLKGIRENKIE